MHALLVVVALALSAPGGTSAGDAARPASGPGCCSPSDLQCLMALAPARGRTTRSVAREHQAREPQLAVLDLAPRWLETSLATWLDVLSRVRRRAVSPR